MRDLFFLRACRLLFLKGKRKTVANATAVFIMRIDYQPDPIVLFFGLNLAEMTVIDAARK